MRGNPVALGVVAVGFRRGRGTAAGKALERVIGEIAGLGQLDDLDSFIYFLFTTSPNWDDQVIAVNLD